MLPLSLTVRLSLLILGLPALLILSLTFVITTLFFCLSSLAVVVTLVIILCPLLILGLAFFAPAVSVGTVLLGVNHAADREQE